MKYSLEQTARDLKTARLKKGLSQRELGEMAGMPQSHISKIEKGAVDLKTSSLIELARVLDLEFMLVPRPLAPTVQGLQRGEFAHDLDEDEQASVPAYRLDDEDGDG